MSDTETPPKPKKKLRKFILLGGLTLVLGGGGLGAGLYATGFSLGGSGPAVDPAKPHLVPRDGVSQAEAARHWSADGDKPVDPAKFKATYYPIEENFTANLRGGDGFVQVAIGISTYYDGRVLENVALHEMAVRSAVLMTLSEQDAASIASTEGREALRGTLKKAINDVLKRKEGFGGIDDVYYTSFVTQ